MQKLTNEYWEDFEFVQNGKVRKDGDKFEQMVADILKCMFQSEQIEFSRTKTTHDGSKDFVGIRDGQRLIWAECKNYNKAISLTQVAPTLVMAEICDIDRILFFSYSEIASITKTKLCRYAQLRRKSLQLYDGDALESLIFSLGDRILCTYFPQYKGKAEKTKIIEPYIFCGLEKDPHFHVLAHDEDVDDWISFTNLTELSIGEIFSANVTIVNRDASHPLKLQICFSSESNAPEDLFCFTFLDDRIKLAGGKQSLEFRVQPGSTSFETVFIRYSKFKPVIHLPTIQVSIFTIKGILICCKNYTFPCVQTNWTRKAVFSGSGYESIKNAFQEACVDCKHFGGMMLFGKSGTGKTRLLEECVGMLLAKHYKILNFTGWETSSTSQIIKEIIYILYGITNEMVLDLLVDNAEENVLGQTQTDFQMVLPLLKGLHKGSISKEDLERYSEIIFEKLMQGGYTLVLDNLQYFEADFLSFLKKLSQYGINRRRTTKSLLLCSINLDQTYDDRYYQFIADFSEWAKFANSRFRCSQVTGFQDEGQAVSFLASILQIPANQLDSQQLRETLLRCSLRPKHIEELAMYLLQKNMVVLHRNSGMIPNPVLLIEELKNVPSEYERLFRERYNQFVGQCGQSSESLIMALSFVHLLKPMEHEAIAFFKISDEAVSELLKGGIIKRERCHGRYLYTFEHDLIEQCFMSDPEFSNIAIHYLVQECAPIYYTLKQNYPAQYCLCRFHDKAISSTEVFKLCQFIKDIIVPSNIEIQFYTELTEWLLEMSRKGILSDYNFLQLATEYCIRIRDFIGEREAEPVFKKCYHKAKEITASTPEVLKWHFAFTIHYCETRNHIESADLYRENTHIYHRYLDSLSRMKSMFPKQEKELEYARAYIQNRLFVCGKHLGCYDEYENDIAQSIRTGERYGFWDILFSNYFDFSSAMLYQDRRTALIHLKTGLDIFEAHPYPQYELNYYKKKIQYSLMTNDLKRLPKIFSKAFACLRASTVVKYHTYFRNCFLQLKIIYLMIIEAPQFQIRQTLDDFNLSQYLLNKEDDYVALFLEAKYAIRTGRTEEAVFLYHRALIKCEYKATMKGELRDLHNRLVIEEEMLPAIRLLGKTWLKNEGTALYEKISHESRRLLKMSKSDYKTYRKKYCSKGLVTTAGCREGFLL